VYPFPGAEPGPSPASGITYPISEVSLTVRDLETRMRSYHEAFGWGPWRIHEADGRRVMHHSEWHGKPADFRVRWAEAMVGDLGFELIEPLGPGNPFAEFLEEKGEGISSISVMFRTVEESERVKAAFAADGIGITALSHIGDDVEWYLLDTEPEFKCIVKSGSGRALDLAVPHTVYP
jgi:hypothetical protein